MSSDEPFVRLPEHVELSLAESSELLEVIDVAVATARTADELRAAQDAAMVITDKLWPELGDLLDGNEDA